jgi:flagellar biosynthetic protein FlhB
MSSGERTEHPTARRLRKAREDGQAPRSAELSATIVMVVSMIILVLAGTWLATGMAGLMKVGLSLDRKVLNSPGLMASAFAEQLVGAFGYVLPVLLISALAAMAASVANGGVVLSFSAVLPKFSKLNPVNGLGRMFGPRAVTELGKSLLKFILVGIVLLAVLQSQAPDLARLGHMGLQPALASSGRIVLESALWVTLSLLIIAAIDVPLQRRQFIKGLRMTKQEIKDEMKEAEGRPEVRAQIRRRQRGMASAKMMSRVKDADVVVANPDHFAVALSYDPASDAPRCWWPRGSTTWHFVSARKGGDRVSRSSRPRRWRAHCSLRPNLNIRFPRICTSRWLRSSPTSSACPTDVRASHRRCGRYLACPIRCFSMPADGALLSPRWLGDRPIEESNHDLHR